MQQFDIGFEKKIEGFVLGDGEVPAGQLAHLQFQSNFMNKSQAADLFDDLQHNVDWQEEFLWLFGQQRKAPRLIAWYGEPEAEYRYSGQTHQPSPWLPSLLDLKVLLEQQLDCSFNSVLCNLYRDGQDSMGWHADDEKELGHEPVIASINLGANRAFHLKHKKVSSLRHKMRLTSGSLLVMRGATQKFWLHQVPKEKKVTEPRINLTFRQIHT